MTQVRSRVRAFAEAAWRASPGYRDAQVERLVGVLVPRVQAGQLQVASLTSAYLGRVAGEAAVPVVSDEILNARGVPASEVYRRPAVSVYTELAAGKPFEVALEAGATRLVSLAMTDLQMAKVRQSRASLSGGSFTYYRRVLTGNEDCALCMIASTQRYHKGDLMPIHPGCDCDVATLKADEDPGQVLDPDLLERTHDLVGDSGGAVDRSTTDDYRNLLATREHGEVGPVLTWRDQRFTGPADI